MKVSGSRTYPEARDALWMVVGFFTVFYAMDRALDRIPLPHFPASTNDCRWKYELYDRSSLIPDVVFLGSSQGQVGISPHAVDEQIKELTGQSIRSLNLCAPAAPMYTQYLIARRIVESGRIPAVAYLEVNSLIPDVANLLGLKIGFRALGNWREAKAATTIDAELFGQAARAALFSSYRKWRDCRLIAKLYMLAAPLHPPTKVVHDDRGWATYTDGLLRLEGGDERLPEQKAIPSRKKKRTISNPNPQALRDTVRILRDAGAVVVLLEMPQASQYTSEPPAEATSLFHELISETVSKFDVRILRPPSPLVTDEDFFDPLHLNIHGALKMSHWLAEDVANTLSNAAKTAPTHQPLGPEQRTTE